MQVPLELVVNLDGQHPKHHLTPDFHIRRVDPGTQLLQLVQRPPLSQDRQPRQHGRHVSQVVLQVEGRGDPIRAQTAQQGLVGLEQIRERLGLTSLRYQRLDDLVEAIGLPREKVCTYCWDGAE